MAYPQKSFRLGAARPTFAPEPETLTLQRPASADPSALQLASLLVAGGSEESGARVLLFCVASGSASSGPVLRQIAFALRELRSCSVARINLSVNTAGEQVAAPDLLTGIAGPDWVLTGEACDAVAHWRQTQSKTGTNAPAAALIDLLALLRERFDFILVDAGPVPSSAQSLIVAPYCSGVILLVQPGVTTTREVEHTHAMLVQARAHVLGFMFVEQS